MLKISKRKLIIVIVIILIFISIIFILIKFSIQKKQVNSNLVIKENISSPINIINVNNFLNDEEKIVTNQYKSNNWRIKISKINLDAPILEGTDQEILRKGVGHFENTSKESGNICLAAHNRGYKYNYFQEIKKLEIGDIIIYQMNDMQKQYSVDSNKVIKEIDLSVLKDTKENQITLITCEENQREFRRCVIAKEII